jgi:hypothetical protein
MAAETGIAYVGCRHSNHCGALMPYGLTLAEPGAIEGPIAQLLSAERKVALKEVKKAFIQDWGIALDVEIKVAMTNLWVHNGRTLSNISNSTQFRARAKALHEAVAADIKARGIQAFGITDPADVKIQNGLKDDLACVVRTDLEGVQALSAFILAEFRKSGLRLAARFFEYYLGATGRAMDLSREEALEFDLIKNAVQENVERFKQRNFISPEQSTPGFLAIKEIAEDPGVRFTQFDDHWKVDLNFSVAGIERFLDAAKSDATDTVSAFLATGESSLTSTGDFLLRRQGDRVLVTGTVTHLWTDPAYNFDPDQVFHPESKILERHGKARPFPWQAKWRDEVVGLLQIDKPFTLYRAQASWNHLVSLSCGIAFSVLHRGAESTGLPCIVGKARRSRSSGPPNGPMCSRARCKSRTPSPPSPRAAGPASRQDRLPAMCSRRTDGSRRG